MLVTAGLIDSRYRLGERLGGFEERRTWLAVDEQTGEKVVFKSLFFGPSTDWQQYRLFEREAQTLPKLDHPGIPRFLAAFWLEQPEGHYFCLVQQFVPGGSLDEWMARGRRFEEEQVVDLTEQLLEILEYLHSQDPPLVHRDIKPSNLILGEDGRVYLVDFGAVQVMGQDGRTLTAAGTFGYMAPEHLLGRAVPASDIYGLGVTLWQLLTGHSPEQLAVTSAGEWAMLEHPLLRRWFGRWLALAVQRDASHRFQNGQEALAAFIELRDGGIWRAQFAPPSDLMRFVVLEAGEQRLRVDFLDEYSLPMLSFGSLAGIFVGGWSYKFVRVLTPNLFVYLFSAIWMGLPLLVWFWPVLPSHGIRLEIDENGCQLSWLSGSLVLWRRVLPFGKPVELQVTGLEAGKDDNKVNKRTLCLRNGVRMHRFSARLSDAELNWLLEQFRFHTRKHSAPIDTSENS